MVECCIRTGNKLVLQIIENIQRADITPREKEDAIAEMLAENYSQADIARELSKPIQWVSDIVAGAKVRKIADEAGLNTENIATKTLSQLRSIPDNELASYLARLVAMGGTTRAATSLLNEWKNSSLRQISEYTENLPTTHDDESMIEPTVMSEVDFNTSELADEALKPTTHKSSNSETAQKGVKNPVSKKIEVRWQSFCRSKQIPEKEKTAFAFYKDLISFFENENQ